MINAYLTTDEEHVRRYTLETPLTTRRLERVDGTGIPTFADDTLDVTEITIEIPQQWPHSITIPAVHVTGNGPGVTGGIGAYPAAVPWEKVLDDLGLKPASGEPPAPPEPFLVGAVPTADALPSAPVDYGVYLVRDTAEGRCCMAGEWQTAAFPARTPQDNAYSVSTTYTIPWWCRYLDLIGIGGGGGGRGGGVAAKGGVGAAGGWAARTIERGVDIPWSLTTLTVTIGAGGTGGTGGAFPGNGTAGGATTIASWLNAAGGAAAYDGSSFNANAGTYTYRDRPYTGGAMNNPPGGGGDGGASGIFGGRPGNPGAAGGAWITARQN